MTLPFNEQHFRQWIMHEENNLKPFCISSSMAFVYQQIPENNALVLQVSRAEYGDTWLKQVLRERYSDIERYDRCIPLCDDHDFWLIRRPIETSWDTSALVEAATQLVSLASLQHQQSTW